MVSLRFVKDLGMKQKISFFNVLLWTFPELIWDIGCFQISELNASSLTLTF